MEGVTEGRMAHYFVPGVDHPIPAIIVRAWGGALDGYVNLTCFPDWGNDVHFRVGDPDYVVLGRDARDPRYIYRCAGAAAFWVTSVPHRSAAQDGAAFWDWPARA